MKNKLIKIIIPILSLLTFSNCAFADYEADVLVVTNVAYTATVQIVSSSGPVMIDPETGTHSGLSTVFTLQSNGGDDHFDYVIKSYIDVGGSQVSAYGDDGRLLFAHTTNPPTSAAIANAKTGTAPNKNVFAYPTSIAMGGFRSAFIPNYKTYGNCHVITLDGAVSTGITHQVSGTPCANTYEMSVDEAGTYRSTIEFTIVSL